MKKNLALVLGVLLVFGFVLVSCDSGGGGTAPKVTVWTAARPADNSFPTTANAKTTFATTDSVVMMLTITDPDMDVKGYGYILKRNGEMYSNRSEKDFNQVNNGSTLDTLNIWMKSWGGIQAGTYTIEAYAFDMKGNKSATSTATFTVQ